MNYYMGNCTSWKWVYPHGNAPLASDLLQFLQNCKEKEFTAIWKSLLAVKDAPLTPFEQLLAVMPPQNSNLLPFAFNMILKDPDLGLQKEFPIKIKLDVVKGLKNIYSEPILPPINVELIQKMMRTIPLSGPELDRNVVRDKIFCFKI